MGAGTTFATKVTHYVAMPWKVLFALVPPTDYLGGWLCFVIALSFIGGLTAVIGDMASLFGCVLGIPDAITAITFVALGTSLPDTFASKAAAVEDPTADACVGNVTGSNSVNVFLGLGLPWMIGAIYWAIKGPDSVWTANYPTQAASLKDGEARFIVTAGDLGFSINLFLICCILCLGTLAVRRKFLKAELGGPGLYKILTSVLFVGLWMFYIALSSWKTLQTQAGRNPSSATQVIVIISSLAGVVAVVFVTMIAARFCIKDEHAVDCNRDDKIP